MADPPMRQWPTVDDSKEHTAIDKTRVKKLLHALVQDLKAYEEGASGGKGTPSDVYNALSQVTPASVGASGMPGGAGANNHSSSYPAGELMYKTVQSVNGETTAGGGATGQGFTGEYNNFVQQYSQVIDALYKAAGIQEDADTQSILSDTSQSAGNTTPPGQTSNGQSGDQSSYDDGSQT